jgi:Nucleotidyl transferase AbiEii toxin, Type IV TA system
LLGYPIETVIVEKVCTAMVLAELNTRERDYADLYRLLGTHDVDGDLAGAALDSTARFRGARLQPLSEVVGKLPSADRWHTPPGDSSRVPRRTSIRRCSAMW